MISVFDMQRRPGVVNARTAALVVAVVVLAACGKKDEAVTAPAPGDASSTQAAEPPAEAVSAGVAALDEGALREKARAAYQESRLYAPAGDNAMEFYLALRDKVPGDPGASSALTDLMPMTVIATEQSRDRNDFTEAQRLYGLLEKADKGHPSLPRLKASIAAAQQAELDKAKKLELTAEQEKARQEQLQKDRLQAQAQQQQQAAQELGAQQQSEEAAREAERQATAQREADARAARQREAAPPPAAQPAPAPAAPATPPPAPKPQASDLRAISTPPPSFPVDAYRAGTSGTVQIEFTVGSDGSVSNARVVRATPPRVFDRAALDAVRRWRFEPVAAPVTTRRSIDFKPGN